MPVKSGTRITMPTLTPYVPAGGGGLARAPTATTPLAGAQLQQAIVEALSQEEGLLTEGGADDEGAARALRLGVGAGAGAGVGLGLGLGLA